MPIAVGLILLLSSWLLNHTYLRGALWHDGFIYAAQALSRKYPHIFQHDLFFQYGSQDNFTIFPSLHLQFIDMLGLEYGSLLLLLICNALWLHAFAMLTRQFPSDAGFWCALVLVASLPCDYGLGIFTYGESRLTARSLAEPLVLYASNFLLGQRTDRAALCLLVATAVHPIMAVPGLMLAAIYVAVIHPRTRKPMLALGLLSGAVGYAIYPAARLTVDPAWAQIVRTYTPQVYFDGYRLADYTHILFVTSLLLLTISVTERHKVFWVSVLAMLAAGLDLALLGALTNNALLLQLQVWRVLWLATPCAFLGFAVAVTKFGSLPPLRRLALSLYPAGFLILGNYQAALPGVFAGILSFADDRRAPPVSPKFATAMSAVVLVATLAFGYLRIAPEFIIFNHAWNLLDDPEGFLASWNQWLKPTGWILLPALAYALRRYAQYPLARWASCVCIVLFGAYMAATVAVTARYSQSRADALVFYASSRALADLKQLVGPAPTVYWLDLGNPHHFSDPGLRLFYPWLLLHQPSYLSPLQAAGVVFDRRTALEIERRSAHVGQVLPEGAETKVGIDELRNICRDPVLDYFVTSKPIAWHVAAAFFEPSFNRTFYYYSCKSLHDSTQRF